MYDTGSSQAWVYSKHGCQMDGQGRCPMIESKMFDHLTSSTYKEYSDDIVQLSYALGTVEGKVVSDRFCFDPKLEDLCIDDLKFLFVDQGYQMDNYKSSGFVGMSPQSASWQDPPSFMQQVTEKIDHEKFKAVFSFLFSKTLLRNGVMTFGSYDLGKYSKSGLEQDLFWAEMTENKHYWTLRLGGVKFSGSRRNLLPNTTNLVMDTGMTFCIVPIEDFQDMTSYLFHNHKVVFQESQVYNGFYMGLVTP